MLVQSLAPDFVLNVETAASDSKSGSGDANVKRLVKTLEEKGFQTESRPGPDQAKSVLVFLKLSPSSFLELVQKDLVKNYEFGITSKDDSPSDRPRVVYSYLYNPKECGGCAITPGKGDWSFVKSITPISGYLADEKFFEKAKTSIASPELRTTSLKKVYGTQIAFYFEFLKFYCGLLSVLAVLGLVARLRSKNYSLTYSFVNLVWGTLFWLLWKRRERYLANFWGVQNSHKIDEYDAELTSLNKSFELSSSHKEKLRADGLRFVKQVAFIPVALVFVAVLVSYQLACFVVEIFLSEIYDGPGKSLLTLLPTVLISVFVPILTIIYNLVVDKFLSWEGHDNNYTRSGSFVVKTFVLNFLTGYVPLLITSFIYLPFAHLIQPNLPEIQRTIATNINSSRYVYKYLTKLKSQQEFVFNQGRLDLQFFFFMVTNQVVQIVMKYVLPLVLGPAIKFVKENVLGKKEEVTTKDELEEAEWLEKVRAAVQLPQHSVDDDFRGLALQFGYLQLFGPVWTLGPLVSLLFNIITFKMDELKLSSGKYFRPPIPTRVDSIHPWDYAFLLLTWIGSVISPVVTAFYRHGTKPPKPLGQLAFDKASVNVSSGTVLILVLFASEHLFFALYFIGTKIATFVKSDVELDNDFVDNDIKLRRDHYHSEVKSSDEKLISDLSTGSLSAVDSGEGTLTNRLDKSAVLEQKKRELAEKEKELELRQLQEHREPGDTIIDTFDEKGQPTKAIIDDNTHISAEDLKEIEDLLSEKRISSSPEEPVSKKSEDSVQSESSSKRGSKKKDFKKFLKRKG